MTSSCVTKTSFKENSEFFQPHFSFTQGLPRRKGATLAPWGNLGRSPGPGNEDGVMTKRWTVFAYGVLSYALFFVTYLYAIGFIGNMYVPKSMDSAGGASFWQAFLIDSLLLGIFAIQHSVMARPVFKRVWTRLIPEAAER